MAVVQISKIQLRRGQKNSQSGIPQLSSAEMAWAVDTQELFIGNGSVSEGAPYVGNTKILTEHDNLFSLISGYRFGNDDFSIVNTLTRSLQGKIDEIEVSVRDYGAVDDGSTDASQAFNKALRELYLNSDDRYKKVLKVPNGRYLFLQDIEIPSRTNLRGETKEGVEIILGNSTIKFLNDNGENQFNFTSGNVPENIEISNLTVSRDTGQIDITGVRNSVFKNLIFKGNYELTDGLVDDYETVASAVFWQNNNVGTATTDIVFRDCRFEHNKLSVKCRQTAVFETRIRFSHCNFFVNSSSIYVQGVADQRNDWTVDHCIFEEIFGETIHFVQGINTIIRDSKFIKCANGINEFSNPLFNIIKFGQSKANIVNDCLFDRQQSAGIVTAATTFYPSEVSNASQVSFINRNFTNVTKSDSFIPVAVFSAKNRFIKINYLLRLAEYSRFGIVSISIDDELSIANISDDYTYSDLTPSSTGGSIMTNFEFAVELRDNDLDSVIETLVLSYRNPLLTGAIGELSFSVSYGI